MSPGMIPTLRFPGECDAVQVWHVRDATYRLKCILSPDHPGDHAAAELEHLEGEEE